MQLSYILSFLACTAQLSIAYPLQQEIRAAGNPSDEEVTQAVDRLAKNADTVSSVLNKLPSLTDESEISKTAKRGVDAESDEDGQRTVLAAAAGSAGDKSNKLIMKYGPSVLSGLEAIAKAGTVKSVEQNVPKIEKIRNPNILPSITQLSNAALDANDINNKRAKSFPPTNASSKMSQISSNGTANNDNNNNKNDDNNNNKNDDNNNNKKDDNNITTRRTTITTTRRQTTTTTTRT
ncbi:hypothetical protein EPUL_005955, partial [Erysiphe pulchra]